MKQNKYEKNNLIFAEAAYLWYLIIEHRMNHFTIVDRRRYRLDNNANSFAFRSSILC